MIDLKPYEFRLDVNEGPVNSGWRPVNESDRKQLSMSCAGADAIDFDRLMAMPPITTHLYRAFNTLMIQIYGPNWKWRPQFQHYGTCVGQAVKRAVDILNAIYAIFYGMQYPGNSSVAGAYTFARVEIAGQPGRWEGANGYEAAAGLIKYGTLLLKHIRLPEDSREADEELAMQWTATRQGVPARYEEMAKVITVTNVYHPKNAMEAAKLIQAGSPQFVGTTYIPTGNRDINGLSVCRRSRQGHEMEVDAVIYRNNLPWAFHEQNSWDFWGTGPLPDDTPPGSVWISARDYEIQMADGDANSIMGVRGLKYDN